MTEQTTTTAPATPNAVGVREPIAPAVPIPADDAHLQSDTAAEVPGPADVEERSGPFADLELEDDGLPSETDLTTALKAVVDPEIGYNIVDLGLVYKVSKRDGGEVHVLMTLTSMGCPLTEVIHQQCTVVLGSLPGVEDVEVEFTFSPPWDTSFIADWVAEELRALGMNV